MKRFSLAAFLLFVSPAFAAKGWLACIPGLGGAATPAPLSFAYVPQEMRLDGVVLREDFALPANLFVLPNGAILRDTPRPADYYTSSYCQLGSAWMPGNAGGFHCPLLRRHETTRFRSGLPYGPDTRWPGLEEYRKYVDAYLAQVAAPDADAFRRLEATLQPAFERAMVAELFRTVHDRIGDWRMRGDPYFNRVQAALYDQPGKKADLRTPTALFRALEHDFPAVSRTERRFRDPLLAALRLAAQRDEKLAAYYLHLPTRFTFTDGYWVTVTHRWSVTGRWQNGEIRIDTFRLEDDSGTTGYKSFFSEFAAGHASLENVSFDTRHREGWRSPQEVLDFLYWQHRNAWSQD